jgi:hypothetical protein
MRRVLLALFLSLLASGLAHATAPAVRPVELKQLTLTDGRKFSGVTLVGYDAANDQFRISIGQDQLTLASSLIAEPSAAELRRAAPKLPPPAPRPAQSAAPGAKAAPSSPPASPSSSSPPAAAATAPAPMPVAVSQPVYTTPFLPPSSTPAPVPAAHRLAALDRAQLFYRLQLRAPSEAGYVLVHRVDVNEPQPVAGFPGRFRTTGQAEFENFVRGNRSLGRTFSTFEVVTEQIGSEPVRVIDFLRLM